MLVHNRCFINTWWLHYRGSPGAGLIWYCWRRTEGTTKHLNPTPTLWFWAWVPPAMNDTGSYSPWGKVNGPGITGIGTEWSLKSGSTGNRTTPPSGGGEDACAQPAPHHRPALPCPAWSYILEFRWELARLCPAISGGGWWPRCRNCWELSMWLGWATWFMLCRTLTWGGRAQ